MSLSFLSLDQISSLFSSANQRLIVLATFYTAPCLQFTHSHTIEYFNPHSNYLLRLLCIDVLWTPKMLMDAEDALRAGQRGQPTADHRSQTRTEVPGVRLVPGLLATGLNHIAVAGDDAIYGRQRAHARESTHRNPKPKRPWHSWPCLRGLCPSRTRERACGGRCRVASSW